MTLTLPTAIADAIQEHARAGAPEEIVGILAGHRENGNSTVTRAYRATNAAKRPRTRYEIAPQMELELLDRIDDAGLETVGFYHSHPKGPIEPSETDAELAAWPGYSYVIVSLGSDRPEIGSWRWRGDRFEREPVWIE